MKEASSIKEIVQLAASEMEESGKRSASAYMAILRGIDRINNMRGGLVVKFGAHSGKTWNELPDEYRAWLRDQIKSSVSGADLMALVIK